MIAVIGLSLLWPWDKASRLIDKAAKKCAAAELAWDDYRSCRTTGYKDYRCESFRATAIEKEGECAAVDAARMKAINEYSGTTYPEKVALFLEFQGSNASVKEQAETVGEICADFGGSDFEWTAYEEERREMWDARHSAAYAAMAVRPTAKVYATDVCVPISRLADCIRETHDDVERSADITSFLLGHIGDGNFHYVFLIDPDDPSEYELVRQLSERMVQRAIRMGGTCTSEHGVGLGKQKFLQLEFGEEAIALMRTIESAMDLHDILNPGKLVPAG